MFEKFFLKNTIKGIHKGGSGQISTIKLLKNINSIILGAGKRQKVRDILFPKPSLYL